MPTLPVPGLQTDYVREAWDKIISELSDATKEGETPAGHNGTGAAWRDKLRGFGTNLKEGETATLFGSDGQKAVYDRSKRRDYTRKQSPSQAYAEHATLTGEIHDVDSHYHTFRMTLKDGAMVIAETPAEYRTEVREARKEHDRGFHVAATIQGAVEFNEQDQPTRILRITEITLLHPLDIDRQIEGLLKLDKGWLDGEGEPLDAAGLHWLRDSFQSRIAFSDRTMPHLYPTEDSGVQAEWTISNISADLDVNLVNHQAIWGWSDLSTENSGERSLDLDKETDWQWLSEALQEMAARSAT